MGEAMIGALIRSKVAAAGEIMASDINASRRTHLAETYGITVTENTLALFSGCRVVILAVKPQDTVALLSQIAAQKNYRMLRRKLLISIVAGLTLAKLESLLYPPLADADRKMLPIIRVMPNTPALVSAGISGMSPNRHAAAEDLHTARIVLEAMGEVIEFEEAALNAVTALSGSGPAYVFYLAESMIESGIRLGLDPNDSAALSLATLRGAVKLLDASKASPEELRRKVTSPGGTTEAALGILEGNGVKQRIIEAIAAAAERAKQLSG